MAELGRQPGLPPVVPGDPRADPTSAAAVEIPNAPASPYLATEAPNAVRFLDGVRSRLVIRIVVAVFLAILAIEAVILVPSYFKREGEIVERRIANARAVAMMVLHGDESDWVTGQTLGVDGGLSAVRAG